MRRIGVRSLIARMKTFALARRTCQLKTELPFGIYGGAECFFFDVDVDNHLEIVTYQGPGIYGSSLFHGRDHVRQQLPKSTCVSAFRLDGTRLWTWGVPNPPDFPYLSHSCECCLDCADVDGDGENEVVVADGDRVILLDGKTGQVKRTCSLVGDNYYIVKALGQPTGVHEAAVVVKNGEIGHGTWRYGEPVVGLNADLDIVWGPKAVLGGGHHILAEDLRGTGRREYIVGYSAMAPDGGVRWTLDAVDPEGFDPDSMHVDYTDVAERPTGGKILAIAGSDRFYLVSSDGRTLLERPAIHAQGSGFGRLGRNSEMRLVCYDAPNGPITLYDLDGIMLWSRIAPRRWPLGMPDACKGRRFHRNRPVVVLGDAQQWIGYADGGWPWGMNGNGKISLHFAPPENSREPGTGATEGVPGRGDDLGLGFAMQCVDIDSDGKSEALIYNRRFLWVFALP